MELREPPRSPARAAADFITRGLLLLVLTLLAGVLAILLLRPAMPARRADSGERARQVAAKLQAVGALDEAAALYEEYLGEGAPGADERARIAYSLGNNYLESGRIELALRWFYEAESLGVPELGDELSARIVHCLERLGRHHAAQAALAGRVELDAEPAEHASDDPVVARIGTEEVRRSQIHRALDALPPELARGYATAAGREEFLRKYVADELLWNKAVKLEYDRDAEVQRRHAQALKQLAVGRFVEAEVLARIEVDESDLRNFFAAHRERYSRPAESGGDTPEELPFEQVRSLVEQDYRLQKLQSAYDQLIQSELATQDVELYPERLDDGP